MLPRRLLVLMLLVLAMCIGSTGTALADIAAASQPAGGPGGTVYRYSSVEDPIQAGFGMNAAAIFEPSDSAGDELPVICFNHGYYPQDPKKTIADYQEFIEHLVKKGYIVIAPYYQNAVTLPGQFTDNCASGIKNALTVLNWTWRWSSHPKPKYVNGVLQFGMMGHSMGGIMTGNLAAKYDTYGIPKPLALCAMNQENGPLVDREWEEGSGLLFDSDTNVLVIVGEDDTTITHEASESFWNACARIDTGRKDWIWIQSVRSSRRTG